jgi:hypothetical protein
MRRVLFVLGIAFACVLIALVAFFMFWDPCLDESFEEFRSPAGKWKVVVFQRSCGATTGFSTQVSVLAPDAVPPRAAGNVLCIDDDHGKVPLDSNGRIALWVRFDGPSAVTLAYPGDARVFTQRSNERGVHVRHERLSAGDLAKLPFRMMVENIYDIPALGPTVTGYASSGTVRVGDQLVVVGDRGRREVRVTAIQNGHESLRQATTTDNPIGISLSGVARDDLRTRDLLVVEGGANAPTR